MSTLPHDAQPPLPVAAPLPPPRPAVVGAAPAGWFADPWVYGRLRWWDGSTWTAASVPAVAHAPRPAMRTLPVRAALWAIVVTVAALIGSRLVLEQLGGLGWPIAAYTIVSLVLGYGPMVAYCVWASRWWGTGRLGDDLGFRARWSDAGWGPLTWLAALAGEITVAVAVTATNIPIRSNTEGIDDLSGERGVIIALLLSAVIAAPFVEELMFRGVILRGLASSMPAWSAVGVQGALFGAAHVDPSGGAGNIGLVAVLSAVGIVLGASAYLLRRIGPTIIAHMIFNGVVLMIVMFVDL